MKFVSFGSGSCGNCYFIYNDTEGIMIDAGVGIRSVKRRLSDCGIPCSMVKSVFITHDHADHAKSVAAMARLYCPVFYATQEVHKGIDLNYGVRRKIPAEMRRYLTKGEPVQVGCFTVTPFAVPHDSADNVGYRIEFEGRTFCIITDAGHVTEVMKANIRLADYLVIEADYDEDMLRMGKYPEHLKKRIAGGDGHLSNRLCGETLAENATSRLKHVWLCHLSGENNSPIKAFEKVSEMLESHGITVGSSLELDVLLRNKMSKVFELR